MKILAIEKDLAPLPGERREKLLRAEARAVWDLQQSGLLREAYFHQERAQAFLVLECAGEDEARRALGSLPLVAAGCTTFETFPLAPYPGFSRLFGGQAGAP